MASIPKSAYLDGVAFAINPIFVIDDPRQQQNRTVDYGLALALNYDLSKAQSLVNCKYEFTTENSYKLMLEQEQQQYGLQEQKKKKHHHRHHRRRSKQRVKKKSSDLNHLGGSGAGDDNDGDDDDGNENRSMNDDNDDDDIGQKEGGAEKHEDTGIKPSSPPSPPSQPSHRCRHRLGNRQPRSMSSHNIFRAGGSHDLDDEATEAAAQPQSYYGSNYEPNATLSSSLSSYSYPTTMTAAMIDDLVIANNGRSNPLLLPHFSPAPLHHHHPKCLLSYSHHLQPLAANHVTATAANSAGTTSTQAATAAQLPPPHQILHPSVPSVIAPPGPPPPQPPSTSISKNTNFYFFNHPVSSLLEPTVNSKTTTTMATSLKPPKDDINNNVSVSAVAETTNGSMATMDVATTPAKATSVKKYSHDILDDVDVMHARSSLDPFHDMELKTINDFEELKSILTNHSNAQPPQPQQTQPIQSNAFAASTTLSTINGGTLNHINNTTTLSSSSSSRSENGAISMMLIDNFGLPKISFVDLDMKK